MWARAAFGAKGVLVGGFGLNRSNLGCAFDAGSEDDKESARLDNPPLVSYLAPMVAIVTPEIRPGTVQTTEDQPKSTLEPGYLVICWNDPVNYMDYVTHVFQVVFGWQRKKAEFHMLQVHNQGRSILARESLEKAEHYVHQLQKYTLHASMELDE